MTLTTEQCDLLRALEGADAPYRTTDLLAKRTNMSRREVESRLRALEALSPPLVRYVYDEEWQLQAWEPTDAARGACD